MKTDPYKLMSDSEYSVIKSDVIKSFDCICIYIDQIYVAIATRFLPFVPELWPLIYAKVSFPLNIMKTNLQNFTKFYICIHIDKIYFGLVTRH